MSLEASQVPLETGRAGHTGRFHQGGL